MKITLKVWRQKNNAAKGQFETYKLDHVSEDMSFLEMFDVLKFVVLIVGITRLGAYKIP